jgi:hypothetical protein
MAVPYYDLTELLRRMEDAMRRTEMIVADAREHIQRVDKLLDQLEAMRTAKAQQTGHRRPPSI